MTYTINELNGSGKRVVLTEGNGRDDAANVCHLLNKHPGCKIRGEYKHKEAA